MKAGKVIGITLGAVLLLFIAVGIYMYGFEEPQKRKEEKTAKMLNYLETKYSEKFTIKETCFYSNAGGAQDYKFVVESSSGKKFGASVISDRLDENPEYFDSYKSSQEVPFQGRGCVI
jgi:hypothetical protein